MWQSFGKGVYLISLADGTVEGTVVLRNPFHSDNEWDVVVQGYAGTSRRSFVVSGTVDEAKRVCLEEIDARIEKIQRERGKA